MKAAKRPAKTLRRPLQLRLGFQLEMFDEAPVAALQERDGRARAGIEAALEEAIARAAHEGIPRKPNERTCLGCEGRGVIYFEDPSGDVGEPDDCPDCDGCRYEVQCELCGEWMPATAFRHEGPGPWGGCRS